MAQLCVSTCVRENPPTSYEVCGGKVFRKAGGERIGFIRCDQAEFVDPTDPAEWRAKLEAGYIMWAPCGMIKKGVPQADLFRPYGCRPQVTGEKTHTIDYETYETERNYLDECFWQDVEDNCGNYRLLACDCNGGILMDYDYAKFVKTNGAQGDIVGKGIGIEWGFSIPPYPIEGDAGYEKWVAQVTFQSHPFRCPQRAALSEIKELFEEVLLVD